MICHLQNQKEHLCNILIRFDSNHNVTVTMWCRQKNRRSPDSNEETFTSK